MQIKNRIFALFLVFGLLLTGNALWAKQTGAPILVPGGADQPPKVLQLSSADKTPAPVTDLTKAYEVWKNKGIKFVVRDASGKFIGWNVGRLESWGSKSNWVVRDTKGHFMTHAHGAIETWKNGKTRLVLRTAKGHLLTHIDINLTDKSTFAHNVVGLRKLSGDSKFIGFVQESLGELIVADLKKDDTIKAKVLLDYIRKYQNQKTGMKNFVPVLRLVVRQLNYMATQQNDSVIESLANAARDLLNELN